MKVVVVIPAYNEEKNIHKLVSSVRRLKMINKIIVVDDGSKDSTAKLAKTAGAKIVRYEDNMGVGYATRVGLKEAQKMKPSIIICMDSDGQHDPKYIPKFIEKIEMGYDYVYGLRDLYNYPIDRKIGNFFLRILTNILCPTGILDTECGYRAMTFDAAKKVKLRATGYEREVDFAYEIWRNSFKIGIVNIIVPIFYPKPAIKRGIKNFFYLIKRKFGML